MSARINDELAPTYEALKAERDALAVENRRLCERLTHAEGCFSAATFEGLDEALVESAGSMLADIVSRRIVYAFPAIKEPRSATSAALAAIEARGVEKFVTLIAERLRTAGGEDGYSLVNYGEYADHLETKGEEYATELREAK